MQKRKRTRRKGGIDDEKSKDTNKKFKKVQNNEELESEDCNLGVTSRNNSSGKAYSNGVTPCLNDNLETGNIKSDKNPLAVKTFCSPAVDGKSIEMKTMDMTERVKQDFVRDETRDKRES